MFLLFLLKFHVKAKNPCQITNFFKTATWLPHDQLWATIEGTASLT